MTVYLAKSKLTGTLYPSHFIKPDPLYYDSYPVDIPLEEIKTIYNTINQYDELQLQLERLFNQAQTHAQHTSPA